MKKLIIVMSVFAMIFATTACQNAHWRDRIDIDEEYDGIEAIHIEYNVGTLHIKSGDVFRIEGENVYESTFESKVQDGVWYISNTLESSRRFFRNFRLHFGPWRDSQSTVTIYIPNEVLLDEFTIILGAGKIEADGLRTENFTVKVGVGDVTINNLFAGYATIECGVGSIKIDGEISKDSTVQCGVGSISLDFAGAYDEYNYKVVVGLGSASINENEYSGTTRTSVNNPDAKGTFNIDVGVGEVSLKIG